MNRHTSINNQSKYLVLSTDWWYSIAGRMYGLTDSLEDEDEDVCRWPTDGPRALVAGKHKQRLRKRGCAGVAEVYTIRARALTAAHTVLVIAVSTITCIMATTCRPRSTKYNEGTARCRGMNADVIPRALIANASCYTAEEVMAQTDWSGSYSSLN